MFFFALLIETNGRFQTETPLYTLANTKRNRTTKAEPELTESLVGRE
jgi:hypothetical protein